MAGKVRIRHTDEGIARLRPRVREISFWDTRVTGLGVTMREPVGHRLIDRSGHCERDAFAAAVLVARMEDQTLDQAPVWDHLAGFDGRLWRGAVALVSAGYQGFFTAAEVGAPHRQFVLDHAEGLHGQAGHAVLDHRARLWPPPNVPNGRCWRPAKSSCGKLTDGKAHPCQSAPKPLTSPPDAPDNQSTRRTSFRNFHHIRDTI